MRGKDKIASAREINILCYDLSRGEGRTKAEGQTDLRRFNENVGLVKAASSILQRKYRIKLNSSI